MKVINTKNNETFILVEGKFGLELAYSKDGLGIITYSEKRHGRKYILDLVESAERRSV